MTPPAPNPGATAPDGGAGQEQRTAPEGGGTPPLHPAPVGAGSPRPPSGLFITFEGVEGAGKTTQIARLAARLREAGRRDVLTTREPGDGPLGAELRSLALHPPMGMVVEPRAELLIMLADRAQHVGQVIRPHLESGGVVVCDRYADSSVAYQGHGRGLDVGEIVRLNDYATAGLAPDLTILLDLDPALGLARQRERSVMEAQALPFHQRIRAGFLTLAGADPARWLTLDAARPPDEVHADIWAAVSARLSTP